MRTRARGGFRWASRLTNVALYAVLALAAVPFVAPLMWMVSASLKPENEVFEFPPRLVGSTLRLDNYADAFNLAPFASQYWNSLYIGGLTVLGTVVVATVAGYSFARVPFRGRDTLFVLFLSALLLPVESIIVPLFAIFNWLGLIGTHIPLIVEPIFGASGVIAIFIMRQAFLAVPGELEDAGRIDGLGRPGLLWHIAIPLVRPAVVTVALLTFIQSWNLFLEPLVFTGGVPTQWTVPVGLDQYIDFSGTPIWTVQMAATTMAVLPLAIAFIWAQRHITEGIATTGLRG